MRQHENVPDSKKAIEDEHEHEPINNLGSSILKLIKEMENELWNDFRRHKKEDNLSHGSAPFSVVNLTEKMQDNDELHTIPNHEIEDSNGSEHNTLKALLSYL